MSLLPSIELVNYPGLTFPGIRHDHAVPAPVEAGELVLVLASWAASEHGTVTTPQPEQQSAEH